MSVTATVEGRLTIEQRLSLVAFEHDKTPHITLNQELCAACVEKPCLYFCPAELFSLGPDGKTHHNYEGCLECGTCRVACPKGSVTWENPRGGLGVHYVYG